MERGGSTGLADFFRVRGAQMRCRKGELILHAQDTIDHVFYLESGFVKVYSVNSRGEEYTLVVYGPGELFPFTWLPERVGRDVYYEALSPCSLLRAQPTILETTVRSSPALAFEMIERALNQHGIFIDRINNLQYRYARERLVYCLLNWAKRFGVASGRSYEINLRISHQALASNINLSRESVGREIDRLVRKGTVAIRNGQIVLNDIPALAAELPGTSVSSNWWGLLETNQA